ncbi:MAG TPA: hypothetical protein VGM02_17285 [Acidobacteriaceae bacterium]|jgi:hypothetical protein
MEWRRIQARGLGEDQTGVDVFFADTTTRQVATILRALGLNSAALDAVRAEGTTVLPKLSHGSQGIATSSLFHATELEGLASH